MEAIRNPLFLDMKKWGFGETNKTIAPSIYHNKLTIKGYSNGI